MNLTVEQSERLVQAFERQAATTRQAVATEGLVQALEKQATAAKRVVAVVEKQAAADQFMELVKPMMGTSAEVMKKFKDELDQE
jgi:hypothetical protein